MKRNQVRLIIHFDQDLFGQRVRPSCRLERPTRFEGLIYLSPDQWRMWRALSALSKDWGLGLPYASYKALAIKLWPSAVCKHDGAMIIVIDRKDLEASAR